MKRVVDARFDEIVEGVDALPGPDEVQSAMHDLHAEVVLLVEHQADLLFGVDGGAASALRFGQLATDELAFDEKLVIDRLQQLDIDIDQVLGAMDAEYGLAQRALD